MTRLVNDNESELIADLREVIDAVRKDYRLRERVANAPMPILRAAAILAGHPGMESSALAEALRLERSTVSNLLRDMQARGLLHRDKLRTDKRYVSLELTQRGHALLLKVSNVGSGLLARAARQLGAAESARLSLALKPLLLAIRSDGVARLPSKITRSGMKS